MPVDQVADPGIDPDIGMPPKSQNPPTQNIGSRGSTDLAVGKTNTDIKPQMLGVGGGRVMSGATSLTPRPPEPVKQYEPPKSDMQLALDFRPDREQVRTNQTGVGLRGTVNAVKSMPEAMLGSFAKRNSQLNKSVQNMAAAPFSGIASGLKNVSSGLQSAGTKTIGASPLITSTVQQLSTAMQPPLFKKSEAVSDLFAALEKVALISPKVIPQEHQSRVAERLISEDPRLLVYHGLGTGKSLASILAAEKAKEEHGDEYGVVTPASLRQNFNKEIEKFTLDSKPEVLSHTGMGLGKTFKQQPNTLIVDEAHRLRNPQAQSSKAIADAAAKARRLLLLTGSPIVNAPSDLASPISMLTGQKITPEEFEKKYVGKRKVYPGLFARLRGVAPGEEEYVKNEKELRSLLKGRVDYQPGKSPEGVNVNEEIVEVPLSREQERIQNAIRKQIPLKYLWKIDSEFPMTKEEVKKLNAFLNGLRQVAVSTQTFRADKSPLKAFEQSEKLKTALNKLKEMVTADPRKKAIIYSNFIQAGLDPYAAALAKENIPHGVFHGGISENERKKALDEYNAGRLRALLIGPAGAEGISTKGTNLIQILGPHWNEARTSQAKGRGLRFDSHEGLPEDLKDVLVQRYVSTSQEPGLLNKLFGASRTRTGDEIIQTLSKQKEELNEKFRRILREEGRRSKEEEPQ